MKAIFYNGDINIDDIPILELLIAGNTVADLLIDRGADGFGKSVVVQGGRDGLLDIHRIVVADVIEFIGGNPRFDIGDDHPELLGGQLAGDSHFLNFVSCFDMYTHALSRGVYPQNWPGRKPASLGVIFIYYALNMGFRLL